MAKRSRQREAGRGVPRLDEAGQAQAQAHLSLAEALAGQRYQRCGGRMPLDELCSEAHLALLYATNLFDAGKGVPFGAYVTMVIRHRLVHAVACRKGGRGLEQLCFTDALAAHSAGTRKVFDSICPRTPEPDRLVAARDLIDRVRRSMPAKWFAMLEMHYCLDYTLEQIGAACGLSRERVRRLLERAVERARTHCPDMS